MNKYQTVTVVPPTPEDGGITKTQGAKVLLADGTELGLVTRIELSAGIGDIWRGTIELMPAAGVMKGMTVSLMPGRASWWRTLLCRLAGVTVDATDMARDSRAWRKP